jgi:hypothetical protein
MKKMQAMGGGAGGVGNGMPGGYGAAGLNASITSSQVPSMYSASGRKLGSDEAKATYLAE